MKLNYSSLSQPVSAADVAAYKSVRPTTTTQRIERLAYSSVIIVGIIIFLPVLIPAAIAIFSGDMSVLMSVVAWVAVIVAIGMAVVLYGRYQQQKHVKLYRFALQNQLTYIEDRGNPGYTGMIFDEGHARAITEGLELPDGTEIGNYEYVTGSGKSRTTHTYGYVKIPLTRNLPHMVLDGKANNFLGFTGMTDSFDRSQKLSLEGDFDKYFTLYAPKEYEADALYVFTPDVMQTLIEEGTRYDMEIVDDELFIYSNASFNLLSEPQLASLMKIIDTIGTEIRSQTKRYADERVAGLGQNVVATEGRRLHKGISLVTIVVLGVILLNIVLSVLDATHSPIAQVIYIGLGVAVWIGGCVIVLRRIKLR